MFFFCDAFFIEKFTCEIHMLPVANFASTLFTFLRQNTCLDIIELMLQQNN